MKWIIEMPEDWEPEVYDKEKEDRCEFCPFLEARKEDGTYFCYPGTCPLAHAMKMV